MPRAISSRRQTEHLGAKAPVLVSSDVRRYNLAAILRSVDADPDASRGSIARATGLTRTGVNTLVAQLVEAGILAEEEPHLSRVGRPSPRLRLAGENYCAISVEVQRTAISTMVADLAGGHQRTWREATHRVESSEIAAVIADQVRSAMAETHGARLLRIVLAVHGQVDTTTGQVRWNWHADWRDFDVVGVVRRAVPDGVPIVVENDATVAAMAELRHGAGSEPWLRSIVSVSSDLGIGVGVILDGAPFRGSHGFGAELGHTLIDPDGPVCNCGRRGCWSALIGLRNVFREAMPETATSIERLRGYESLAAEALRTAALNSDRQTLTVLEKTGHLLGVGAANAANIFDPERIVVGGYLVDVAPWVLEPAREVFGDRVLRPADPTRDLTMSVLGKDRVLRGGLTVARDALIANPAALMTEPGPS